MHNDDPNNTRWPMELLFEIHKHFYILVSDKSPSVLCSQPPSKFKNMFASLTGKFLSPRDKIDFSLFT